MVPGGFVLFSLIGYTLIYGALMAATVFLMVKYTKAGPKPAGDLPDDLLEADAPSLVGVQNGEEA